MSLCLNVLQIFICIFSSFSDPEKFQAYKAAIN